MIRGVRRIGGGVLLAALAGCAAPDAVPRPDTANRRAPLHEAGLDRVVGRDAKALVALFGPADQDLREMSARRLQFTGPLCVLDAYLYAASASAPPTVTYIDARTPQGEDFDRASCIAALTRRHAAR